MTQSKPKVTHTYTPDKLLKLGQVLTTYRLKCGCEMSLNEDETEAISIEFCETSRKNQYASGMLNELQRQVKEGHHGPI